MQGNRFGRYRIAMTGLLAVASLGWALRVGGQGTQRVTADQIKAGYDSRRSVVLQALRNDPGGNLWHAASKGLAALYSEPVAPEQALINLSQAAAADPRCAEHCGRGECGDGAGYWS